MRTVILHYHLFKNAGTSIDKILKDNFRDQWVTREFTGLNNTDQVIEWILSNPDAIAFSSHTMNGPIPTICDVNIISIAFLRNPISRIISAYNLEKKQDANTYGAKLAKKVDLENYILTRLQRDNDYQCRNFQTERLSTLTQSSHTRLERAKITISDITVLGIVEEFQAALNLLKKEITRYYPDFKVQTIHANQSTNVDKELGPALNQLLHECNKDDHKLWLEGLNIMRSKALSSNLSNQTRD